MATGNPPDLAVKTNNKTQPKTIWQGERNRPSGFPARAADTPSPTGEITIDLSGVCQSAHCSAHLGHASLQDYNSQVQRHVLLSNQ